MKRALALSALLVAAIAFSYHAEAALYLCGVSQVGSTSVWNSQLQQWVTQPIYRYTYCNDGGGGGGDPTTGGGGGAGGGGAWDPSIDGVTPTTDCASADRCCQCKKAAAIKRKACYQTARLSPTPGGKIEAKRQCDSNAAQDKVNCNLGGGCNDGV